MADALETIRGDDGTSHPTRRRRVCRALAGVLLFTIAFGFAWLYDVELKVTSTVSGRPDPSTYLPQYRQVSGPQLIMVYVGSSRCEWSNQPQIPEAVEAIKVRLSRYAENRGWAFMAVGVALDWSVASGVEHLDKFGLFDEISAGSNWGNTLALLTMWSDRRVKFVTPQVLVYQRDLVLPADSTEGLFYYERSRLLLVIRRGARAIISWADSGVVMPPPG